MSPLGSRLLRAALATAFTAIVALPLAPRSRAGADDARAILRAADAAIHGAAFRAAAGLETDGSLSEGGATGSFTQTLDVRSGHERVHVVVGPLDVYQGYDGAS